MSRGIILTALTYRKGELEAPPDRAISASSKIDHIAHARAVPTERQNRVAMHQKELGSVHLAWNAASTSM